LDMTAPFWYIVMPLGGAVHGIRSSHPICLNFIA
jgi:hypothetical protein